MNVAGVGEGVGSNPGTCERQWHEAAVSSTGPKWQGRCKECVERGDSGENMDARADMCVYFPVETQRTYPKWTCDRDSTRKERRLYNIPLTYFAAIMKI